MELIKYGFTCLLDLFSSVATGKEWVVGVIECIVLGVLFFIIGGKVYQRHPDWSNEKNVICSGGILGVFVLALCLIIIIIEQIISFLH